MYFTQEDYKKIEDWLYKRTVRDTDLPKACPINGTEKVPILQNERNKVIGFNDFVKQIALKRPSDFYNVNVQSGKDRMTLEEAVNSIPEYQRKKGLVITFRNERGNWLIYQFNGESVNQWDSLYNWENIIGQALKELIFWPDEEDLTFVDDGNRKFIKFRDREYDPEQFQNMGMIILRKNIEGTEACSIDDEDHLINLLTQEMINQPNTVYVIKYDFDLNGKVISIPKNSVLWFQGGTINNGSIYLSDTAILGAFEFSDTGNANLFGTFNTGQVFTFSNNSYKRKEGGYFNSASLNEVTETFSPAPVNNNAYTTAQRQELRWWNGEEWVLLLDVTDYNEIKAIINDLINKHNAEISQVFQYFKERCTTLETRMTNAENRLTNVEIRSTNLENRATNLENRAYNLEVGLTNEIARATKREDEIAETIRVFLEDRDLQDSTINRWKELEDFLDGITDTETLAGLLKEVSSKAAEGVDKVALDLAKEILDRIEAINNVNKSITNINNSITSINNDISNINNDLSNVKNSITNLQNTISNLETTITTQIEQYLKNNAINKPLTIKLGSGNTAVTTVYDGSEAKTITITPESIGASSNQSGTPTDGSFMAAGNLNGNKEKSLNEIVTPGNYRINGYIDLPPNCQDYGQLLVLRGDTASDTITQIYVDYATGNAYMRSGNFGGTATDFRQRQWVKLLTSVDSNINAATANKVAHKLKFTGAVTAEYDGSSEVTVNIPSPTSVETINTIVNYINRKTIYFTSLHRNISSYLIAKDDIYPLSDKTFLQPTVISSVLLQESPIDQYLVLDKEGKELNLYEVGFDEGIYTESGTEFGIIYSLDKSFVENLNLTTFKEVTSNTTSRGKVRGVVKYTGQILEDKSREYLIILDSSSLNSILDNKKRYYKSFIYNSSKGIFYMATDVYCLLGKRIANTLAPLNEYAFVNLDILKDDIPDYGYDILIDTPNISSGKLEVTYELVNLYKGKSGKAVAYIRNNTYGTSYPLTSTGDCPAGILNSGTIFQADTETSIGGNKYKATFSVPSGNRSRVIYFQVSASYGPDNESADFKKVYDYLYIVPETIKNYKILSRSDYANP